MNPVLAAHGSKEFNQSLWNSALAVATDVRKALGGDLVALVLSGGYGRGEGGVWVEPCGQERPYNDLDFVLVVKKKFPSRMGGALKEISACHGERLGIDVDFSRPLMVPGLRKLPHSMMWHDLVQGHVVVDGPPDILHANVSANLRLPLPRTEGLRLLLNRGAGLLKAMRVGLGIGGDHDSDFRRRNLQKANMALGDAILVSFGCYPAHCLGRRAILEELAGRSPAASQPDLLKLYGAALEFKFRPVSLPLDQPSQGELQEAARWWERVLLETESRRTGREFSSISAYAQWDGVREALSARPAEWPRNLVRNARLGSIALCSPRELLYRELPLLLGADGFCRPDWKARSARFLARWERVN